MRIYLAMIITLVVMYTTPVMADSLSLGFGLQKGHSYSGQEGIEDGFSSYASYQKYKGLGSYFKLGYGLTLMDTYFTEKHNSNSKGNHYKESKEYSLTGTAIGSVYFDYFSRVKPFARLGVGMEWSTDEGWMPVYTPAFGLDVVINKHWSVELMSTHIYDHERRQAVDSIGIKYSF